MGRKDKTISTENVTEVSLGEYLRITRHNKGVSLTQIATLLNYSKGYLSGVENNSKQGSRELVEKYEKALDLPAGTIVGKYFPEKIEEILPAAVRFPIDNLPYRRNPLFTGQEEVINKIYEGLHRENNIINAWVLSGLGGIGKTQIVLEYAYRYACDYEAILWINADSREHLLTDVRAIVRLLHLSESQEQDHACMVQAVKRWLYLHRNWLLILDNADQFELAKEFLIAKSGHILITTRSQAFGGIVRCLNVEPMDLEIGASFLLRRAAMLRADDSFERISEQDQVRAQEIVRLMDGLPLALDQAGAYIDETHAGLDGYLSRLQRSQAKLLERRGRYVIDHPEPVATTWLLALDKVQQTNPIAVDLLYLCAFLNPDTIPEEIFTEDATQPGSVLGRIHEDPLVFDEAISELLKYSFVLRNPDHTLTIHRLVQAVLLDRMDQNERILWAERAIRAIAGLHAKNLKKDI